MTEECEEGYHTSQRPSEAHLQGVMPFSLLQGSGIQQTSTPAWWGAVALLWRVEALLSSAVFPSCSHYWASLRLAFGVRRWKPPNMALLLPGLKLGYSPVTGEDLLVLIPILCLSPQSRTSFRFPVDPAEPAGGRSTSGCILSLQRVRRPNSWLLSRFQLGSVRTAGDFPPLPGVMKVNTSGNCSGPRACPGQRQPKGWRGRRGHHLY